MIYKSQRSYLRRVKTWPSHKYALKVIYHQERVLRETWWLFNVIPIYSREKIEATNL